MNRRVSTIASGASLVMFAATAVFWVASESRSWRESVGIAGRVRVATAGGMIAFFNQSEPFFNGTVSMSVKGSVAPTWPKEVSIQFPGFSFRHFTWPGRFTGGTYWTLGFSFAYPMGVFAVLPAGWCVGWLRRREGRGVCLACSYDLTGNESGVCPGCGSKIG